MVPLIEAHGARIPQIGLGTMTLKDGDGVTVGWATLRHDKP